MMTMLALLLSLAPAHAATIDQLHCEFQYIESTNPIYDFIGDLAGERVKAQTPAGAPYALSHAEVFQTTKVAATDHTVSLAYRLDYQHAILNDQARQTTCLAIQAEVCTTDTPPKCLLQSQSCAFSQDPFNVNYGWPVVPMNNGVPAFAAGELRPAHFTVKDLQNHVVGQASAMCNYRGTTL